MVTRLGRAGWRAQRWAAHRWAAAGLLVLAVVALVDFLTSEQYALAGALLLGPLVTSFGATTRRTVAVAVVACGLAPFLAHRDLVTGGDLVMTVGVVVLGCAVSVALAARREEATRARALAEDGARLAQRLELALGAADMGTWHRDVATGMVTLNAQAGDLFGLRPAGSTAATIVVTFEALWAAVHPDDLDAFRTAIQEGMRTRIPWQVEFRVVRPDGSVHWIEGRGEPVVDEHGTVIGATGVIMDATERHALLDAERFAAKQLALAHAATRMGTWYLDDTTGVLTQDERTAALYGAAPGASVDSFEKLLERIHPDDREAFRAAREDALRSGHGFEVDYRVVWPDGSVHWVEGRGEPVLDELGTLVGVIGAIIDADERHARLQAERLAANQLHLALEAGHMGTWHRTLSDDWVAWDATTNALFGYPPGTTGAPFSDLISRVHPDDRRPFREAVEAALAARTHWHIDYRVLWPDASVHWIEGRGEAVRDARGNVTATTGVVHGVDERHARLARETTARRAAEATSARIQQLADVITALAGCVTIDEVTEVIVGRGVVAAGACSGIVMTADEVSEELVLQAQSGIPPGDHQHLLRIPLDARFQGAEVLRTGRPDFMRSFDERVERFPEFTKTRTVEALATMPVVIPAAGKTPGLRGVVAFGWHNEREFDAEERAYLSTLVEAATQALRRAAAFAAEQETQARLATLLTMSQALAGIDSPDNVFATVAEFAATHVGNRATVFALDPDGDVRLRAAVHRDPALTPAVRKVAEALLDPAPLRRVMASGEPLVLRSLPEPGEGAIAGEDAVREGIADLGWVWSVVVPIPVGEEVTALLTTGASEGDLTDADLEILTELARRTGSALERAQLWELNRERLAAEHHMVEVLQRTILPERMPDVPALTLGAAYRPAEVDIDVGGDWYDAFPTPDGGVVAVVGDVAGHGIDAASVMGRVRNALRAYAATNPDPASVLNRLNHLLRTEPSPPMVTALIVHHLPGSGSIAWARAGHIPPLVVAPDGSCRFRPEAGGPPLGTTHRRYTTTQASVPAGALFVLVTDGLIERRDRSIDEGLAWLAARVSEYRTENLDVLCDKLVANPFVPFPAPDDMCVLALRAEPSSSQSPQGSSS